MGFEPSKVLVGLRAEEAHGFSLGGMRVRSDAEKVPSL